MGGDFKIIWGPGWRSPPSHPGQSTPGRWNILSQSATVNLCKGAGGSCLRCPSGTGAAWGAAKRSFQKIDFREIFNLYQYSNGSELFLVCTHNNRAIPSALKITVRSNEMLSTKAPYGKRRFPICFNSKLLHLKVPFLQLLPPPHYEASELTLNLYFMLQSRDKSLYKSHTLSINQ